MPSFYPDLSEATAPPPPYGASEALAFHPADTNQPYNAWLGHTASKPAVSPAFYGRSGHHGSAFSNNWIWMGGPSYGPAPQRPRPANDSENRIGAISAILLLMSTILAGLISVPYALHKAYKSATNLAEAKKPAKSLWRLASLGFGGLMGWLNGAALGTLIGASIVPGPHSLLIGAVCSAACIAGCTALGAAVGAFFGKYTAQLVSWMVSPDSEGRELSSTNPGKYLPSQSVKRKISALGGNTTEMIRALKDQKNHNASFLNFRNTAKKAPANAVLAQMRDAEAEPVLSDNFIFFKPRIGTETLGWDLNEHVWKEGMVRSGRP